MLKGHDRIAVTQLVQACHDIDFSICLATSLQTINGRDDYVHGYRGYYEPSPELELDSHYLLHTVVELDGTNVFGNLKMGFDEEDIINAIEPYEPGCHTQTVSFCLLINSSRWTENAALHAAFT